MISFVVLLLLLTAAGATLAQEQSGMRFVCVTGFGCGYTPLSNQDILLAFPDSDLFESAGDYAPAGMWTLEYGESTMYCDGMPIHTPSSEERVLFTYMPRLDGEGEWTLLAEAVDDPGLLVLDRLGPGVFVGEYPLDTGDGVMDYYMFYAMSSEFAIDGFLMASGTMQGHQCTLRRSIFGSAAE
jgi:hypothetical protein